MRMHWREQWAARWLPWLLFLAFLILYVSTASRGFIVGSGSEAESMELQRAVVHNGIAHATTYPAYVILAHYFTRIGAALGDDPFTWATYFSSFTTALALMVTYYLCRLWVGWPAAAVATVVFGLSGVMWHIATITEVQGLHILIIVSILYLTALYRRAPHKIALLEGIALLFGLGLANHRIVVLLGPPVALVALVSGALRYLRPWSYVRLAAALGLPLLLYYDVFFKVPAGVVYGLGTTFNPPINAYNALQIVFGYGQEGLLVSPLPELGARLSFVVGHHLDFFTPVGVLLGAAGLIAFFWRDRLFGAALLLHAALSGIFWMTWRQDHKAFIYYAQTGIVLVIGIAALADSALRFAPRLAFLLGARRAAQPEQPARDRALPLALPLALLVPALFVMGFPQHNRAPDRRGQVMYEAYMGLAEPINVFTGGWSPDHWIGLEAVAAGSPAVLIYDRDVDYIVAHANDQSRQVYLSWWMQMFLGMLSGQNPLLDRGLGFAGTDTDFVQVLPRGDARLIAEAEAAVIVDQPAAPGIRLYSYRAQRTADGARFTLYWRVDDPIAERLAPFAHLRTVDAAGETTGLLAQRDYPDPVRGYYPTSAWQPGEVVRDSVFITWPPGALPPAESLRWTFGFVSPATGQRTGEVFLPFEAAQP